MKHKVMTAASILFVLICVTCTLQTRTKDQSQTNAIALTNNNQDVKPHSFVGWYCPDNLNGFPAVDIRNWKQVPVVNGRLATLEEARNGTSLIFIDTAQYPNARPLDIEMPQLAKIYNEHSNREDYIIIIQAVNVANDSIVGYRFLNGGNGSAKFKDVTILSDAEIKTIRSSKFVRYSTEINATQDHVSKVLTDTKHLNLLLPTFGNKHLLPEGWRDHSNLNYFYKKSGKTTSLYASILFGNFYIQNDFEAPHYTEKFLLLTNEQTNQTTLKITCGPFTDNYQSQKNVLTAWADRVKEISEQ